MQHGRMAVNSTILWISRQDIKNKFLDHIAALRDTITESMVSIDYAVVIVDAAAHFKLKKVDMVESLKTSPPCSPLKV